MHILICLKTKSKYNNINIEEEVTNTYDGLKYIID